VLSLIRLIASPPARRGTRHAVLLFCLRHPERVQRATSFGAVAEDYDRLRPRPPADAVEWLLPAHAGLAVDLAAGTGVMTRRLLARPDRVDRVVAVEPDARMRDVLARRSPGVQALEGRGEAIPLPEATADLVVVASAWHWIDAGQAVPEIARVLRDGGRLAVVWSGRNTTVPWMADLIDAVLPHADAERDERERRLRALVIPDGEPFTKVEAAQFDFVRRMTVSEIAESFGTYSRVIALGPERAVQAVDRAREALAERYGGPDVPVDVPFRTRAFRCDRLPRRC
jgi:SAM-dependent methyltransferase